MVRRMAVPAMFGLALTAAVPPVQAQESETTEIRRQIEAMRADYESRIRELEQRLSKTEAAPSPGESTPRRKGNAFNPEISVVLNGGYTHLANDPANARIPGFVSAPEFSVGERGFSLGESELQFKANVDQVLAGQLTVALTGEEEVEVEEAFVETLGLPLGLTLRGGRFFSGIGYLNQKHAHDWDFIDAPLPYVAMLGDQYRDDGVQLRWLAPTPFFLEFGGELFRGDTFPGGNPANGQSAHSAFVHVGDDLSASSSWQAGLSYLRTEARGRESGDAPDSFTGSDDLGIASLVYKWAPDGNPTQRNLTLSGEYFLRQETGTFNDTPVDLDQSGWYAQGVYQFTPQWSAGLRYDRLDPDDVEDAALAGSALDAMGHAPYRAGALLEYDTSEYGRIRLQYNHDESGLDPNQSIRLQYTVILGPHLAHGF